MSFRPRALLKYLNVFIIYLIILNHDFDFPYNRAAYNSGVQNITSVTCKEANESTPCKDTSQSYALRECCSVGGGM